MSLRRICVDTATASGLTNTPTRSKSHAEDINAFLEKLDLNDVVLIGHSMGGMISLIYAATHPGRVSRLIIVDSIMLMPWTASRRCGNSVRDGEELRDTGRTHRALPPRACGIAAGCR